jgi:hypothetical protein
MTGGEREVVRLSLGAGLPTLNVLPVGLEGDTLTLVCPFPVLPIELPVTVTLPWREGVEPVPAMIRRVSVEMMGDTGLPRFKLRLALDHPEGAAEAFGDAADEGGEGPAEEESPPPVETASEAPGDVVEAVEPERAPGTVFEPDAFKKVSDADMSWTSGDFFQSRAKERSGAALTAEGTDRSVRRWADLPEAEVEIDPPWAAVPDAKAVGEVLDSAARRRRRWPVRLAVTVGLLVSVIAVGYVMREQIAAAASPWIGEELTLASLGLPQRPALRAPAARAVAVPTASTEAPASAAPAAAAETDLIEPAAADPTEAEPAIGAALEAVGADEAAASPPAPDPSVVEGDDQLRVVLPTRWPVTEARSYRLNNPSGIVVDVPGGAASERARWIETAHERIRSVRVLEREDGVRFIIYLNDEVVPRYRVGYTRAGVTVDILGPDPRHVASK